MAAIFIPIRDQDMEKRIGNQEPTVHISLPYSGSDGADAVDLYELTGRTALKWQRNVISDILAKNEDGLWVHNRYGYAVPRQNGKGEILAIRELYALAAGERVMHTAHLVATAHAAFERLQVLLDKLGITYKSIKAKGQELIEVTDGGRIQFRTRTAKGGLGESYDLVIIDEAQEYQPEQDAALLYVISASTNPQMILTGTPPTPQSSGTVFRDYREGVLAGSRKYSGWAEWSVPEISDVHDKDLWYMTNPSLGVRLSEITIEGEVGDSDEKILDFNIQRLGLWVQENLQSAISAQDWETTLVNEVPEHAGKMHVGIKYAKAKETVSMAIAFRTVDGRIFVESVGSRPVRDGTGWIMDFLVRTKGKTRKVVVDGKNGQEIIQDEMKDLKLKGCVLPQVSDVINANALWEKGIYDGTICRMEQPALTEVATNCEKRTIGGNGGFGYKEMYAEMDISIMDAALLAAWSVQEFPDRGPQGISY